MSIELDLADYDMWSNKDLQAKVRHPGSLGESPAHAFVGGCTLAAFPPCKQEVAAGLSGGSCAMPAVRAAQLSDASATNYQTTVESWRRQRAYTTWAVEELGKRTVLFVPASAT